MKPKLVSIIVLLLLMYIPGRAQSIQMRVCTNDGSVHVFNISEIRKLTFQPCVGMDNQELNTVIKNFAILKCYPNPFNNTLNMDYVLPGEGMVEISIVDLNGKVIRKLNKGNQSAGMHNLTWDGIIDNGAKAQTGIYFFNVKFNNLVQTNKIILIK